MPRCPWATTEQAIAYHDEEWGVPVHDDRVLFEFLILEGAQAGLSWNTILKKRENYRKAFRRISTGKDRPLRQTRRAAVAAQRWDRTEPVKNRSCNRECEKFSRGSKGIRHFRRLSLEPCWRRADTESLANVG